MSYNEHDININFTVEDVYKAFKESLTKEEVPELAEIFERYTNLSDYERLTNMVKLYCAASYYYADGDVYNLEENDNLGFIYMIEMSRKEAIIEIGDFFERLRGSRISGKEYVMLIETTKNFYNQLEKKERGCY